MLVKLSSWKTIQTSIPISSKNSNRRNGKKSHSSDKHNKLNVSIWNHRYSNGSVTNEDNPLKICVNAPNNIHTYEYNNVTVKECINMNYAIRPGDKNLFHTPNTKDTCPILDEQNGIIYSVTKNGKGLCYWTSTANGPSGDIHTQATLPYKILSMYLHQHTIIGILENGQLFQGRVDTNQGVLNVVLLDGIDTPISNGGSLEFGCILEHSEDKMIVVFITTCMTGEMIVSNYLLQLMNTNRMIESYTTKKKVRKSEEKEEKKEDEFHGYNSVTTSLVLSCTYSVLPKIPGITDMRLCYVDHNTIFLVYTLSTEDEKEWYGCNINITTCQISQPFFITKAKSTPSISPISSSKIILYFNSTLQIIDVFHEASYYQEKVHDAENMKMIAYDNCICLYDIHHNNVTLKCCAVQLQETNEISFKDALLQSQPDPNDLNVKKILKSLSNHFIPTSTAKNGIITSTTSNTNIEITPEQMTHLIHISNHITKRQEKEYETLILHILKNKSLYQLDVLLQAIIYNTTLSSCIVLHIIDTILLHNKDGINEYCIILMIYYFIKNQKQAFHQEVQKYSKKKDDVLPLVTSWISKIITNVSYPTNKPLVSSAMKSVLTSKSSKIILFKILSNTLQQKDHINIKVYLEILIDSFIKDFSSEGMEIKYLRNLMRSSKNDGVVCKEVQFYIDEFNSEHRIGKKRKYSDEFEDGYSLEYLVF